MSLSDHWALSVEIPITADLLTIGISQSVNSGTMDKAPSEDAVYRYITGLGIIPPKQYKFLLSQSGSDDPQTATSGTLTKGVTYEIVTFENGDNFIISGAPNNTVGTKWISNGVAPIWSNGSEIGWNGAAPTVIEFINTIGHVWWEKAGDGYYQLISNGLFIDGKTMITPYLYSGPNTYFEIGLDGIPNSILFYSNQLIYEPQSTTPTNGLFTNHPFTIEIFN